MAATGRRARAARGVAAGRRRRPRVEGPGAEGKPRPAPLRSRDEEVSSEEEAESAAAGRRREEAAAEEELEETPQEKKLRLAKLYLEELRRHEEERAEEEEEEAAGFPGDLVGERLKEAVLEQQGRLRRPAAQDVCPPAAAAIRVLRGHQHSVTCLVVSPDDKFIFSAAKDGSVIKWEVESGKRLCVVPGGKKGTEGQPMGHTAHVLCIAISSDGKYLATGDRSKLILIWEAATCKRLYTFTGHRDAVSGLSFRKGTYQLYSASHDRSVKVWNVEENAYVETLFGHQDIITGMDSLSRECCVTSGGRDGTVRFWKIPEESQLIFYGHQGSIDCIQLINEEHMVSGADDGSVALWGLAKKKPLALVRQSHGTQGAAQDLQQPYWVSAVAALLNSDLVATGSHSGCVKLWKCGEGFQKLEPLCDIPLIGFVNSLKFSSTGDFLVAGIGQEHRLGRWWRVKEAKNSICIIPLKCRAGAPGPPAADCA
ncbi:U3 small nucleolar RNA-interacting protein 2 [Tympanuchus pallidicinctus]|uniref:U3 small nucleolar RNA-interacting protein 2 n=1 Tax=Tympanuchus pallidicinctus TaxID=109042 RepID=UPI0022876B4F|nr:U3 small nucleolar RNA-interacting protein 2 [Tympanuchus pallidicinctus]